AMIELLLAAPFPIYGTIWAFIIAFAIRYLPYGMRYASAGVLQVHPELEEAAGVAGASSWRSLRRGGLSLIRSGVVVGWRFRFLDRGWRRFGGRHASIAVSRAGRGRHVRSVGQWPRNRTCRLRARMDRHDDRRRNGALSGGPAGGRPRIARVSVVFI